MSLQVSPLSLTAIAAATTAMTAGLTATEMNGRVASSVPTSFEGSADSQAPAITHGRAVTVSRSS